MLSRGAQLLDAAQGLSAGERLAPLEAVFPGRDLDPLGQGVHDADADTVQAAGRLVGLARELSAGMQDGHDDLQRRLARMFRMRVNWNAAPVIGDDELAIGVKSHRYDLCVPGDGLVHGIVQDLGEQMVQGALVRAADVHARPLANRLQALEYLDVLGRVAARRANGGRSCGAGLVALRQRRRGCWIQRVIEQRALDGRRFRGRRGHGTLRVRRFSRRPV